MKKILIALILSFSYLSGARLIVLDPAVVEIIYMLNAQDQILAIARPTSEIYPKEKTSKLPIVGSYMKPSLEKIVELKPDLVITSYHSAGVNDDLKNLGIKSITLNANSLQEIYDNIKIVGDIVGKKDEANKLIKKMKTDIKFDKPNLKDKKAVILFAAANLIAFNNNTLPADIITKMGLINIASTLKGVTTSMQAEYLLEQNPDFIIVLNSTDELLKFHPILSNTKAAKTKKIISIGQFSIMRGSPRISFGIEKLYKLLEQ